MSPTRRRLVLRAPSFDFQNFGFFWKLYISTFDCGAVYRHPITDKKNVHGSFHNPPFEPEAQISVFIYMYYIWIIAVWQFRLEDGEVWGTSTHFKASVWCFSWEIRVARDEFLLISRVVFRGVIRIWILAFWIVSELGFQLVSRSSSSIRQAGRDPVGHN